MQRAVLGHDVVSAALPGPPPDHRGAGRDGDGRRVEPERAQVAGGADPDGDPVCPASVDRRVVVADALEPVAVVRLDRERGRGLLCARHSD